MMPFLFRLPALALLLSTGLRPADADPVPQAVARLKEFHDTAAPTAAKKLVFVYFTPADREPPAGYRTRLARVMTDIQAFYASEMERHGLRGRGIHFDQDAKGGLVVHDVKGRQPAAHYLGRDSRKGYEIRDEARPVLTAAGIDDEQETVIYFCHLRTERDGKTTGIGPYYGSGARTGGFHSGRCWFTDATILDPDLLEDKTTMLQDEEYGRISVGKYNSIFIGGAAHELGHGLGLPHDKERKDEAVRGTSLMGSGNRTYGKERRGEGPGSFLTLADALRLASHPIFSGTTRDIDVKPVCSLEGMKATQLPDGKMEITGQVKASPQPYAVIAYHDPFGGNIVDDKGWHDYASTTWPATLDDAGRFRVAVGEFKPGAENIRLVVCHVNGATSSFRRPVQVREDGLPDLAAFAEVCAPGSLLLCGMGEVFLINPAAAAKGVTEKLWIWSAKDHADLPENMRKAFATTDECKPVEGGKKILITASSGGCALVDYPSGKVIWHAQVPNAHSIELLPHNRVVVAASISAKGNRLLVFDLAKSNDPVCETALPSAHGVVWDEARKCLWALGFTDLRRYELKEWDSSAPALSIAATHALPDEDGHDLQPVPGSPDLVLSTDQHVYLFDRDKAAFRLHPELGGQAKTKCVSVHPSSSRTVSIHGSDNAWWSDCLVFLNPAIQVSLERERIYKARWLVTADTAAKPRSVMKITSANATALVDTNDAPDLKDWGGKAGTLCVEWFSKIAALLPSEGFTAPTEVTLYFDPKMKGVAHALGGKITISAAFVRAHPDDLGMVVHELTHVVQAYPAGGPGWLVEGIADYIRIVHYEPQAQRPWVDPAKASYKDAYKTTAMFLEWVEKNHAAGLVVTLNAALRQGQYEEALWQRLTGKSVDELWRLFVQTLPPMP